MRAFVSHQCLLGAREQYFRTFCWIIPQDCYRMDPSWKWLLCVLSCRCATTSTSQIAAHSVYHHCVQVCLTSTYICHISFKSSVLPTMVNKWSLVTLALIAALDYPGRSDSPWNPRKSRFESDPSPSSNQPTSIHERHKLFKSEEIIVCRSLPALAAATLAVDCRSRWCPAVKSLHTCNPALPSSTMHADMAMHSSSHLPGIP